MLYGLDIPTTGEYASAATLANLAAEAEAAGWDGFFVWDTLFAAGQQDLPVVDPWIALAAIAMKTQHIRSGAMLTPLARRRPWQVARQAVALVHPYREAGATWWIEYEASRTSLAAYRQHIRSGPPKA